MRPPSYMRSVVDRNFVLRCIPVFCSVREGKVVRSAVNKMAALSGATVAPLPCLGTCITAPYSEPAQCGPHYNITEDPFLGAFAKFAENDSELRHVCPSVWINLAPARRIFFFKLNLISQCISKICRENSMLIKNISWLIVTLREALCALINQLISRSVLLRMRNVS
jgi:hypothetical protein